MQLISGLQEAFQNFIDESNPSQKFVERGTKPQFNKFYELISNEQKTAHYEIRKSDILKIVLR